MSHRPNKIVLSLSSVYSGGLTAQGQGQGLEV